MGATLDEVISVAQKAIDNTRSIGVGTMVPEFRTESDFLDAADRAAYKAKINRDMVWPVVNADPDGKPGPS